MKRLHSIDRLQALVFARLGHSSQGVRRHVLGCRETPPRVLKNLQGLRNCQASWVRGLSTCVVSLMLCLGWGFASAADMGFAETKAVIAKAMGISQRLSEPDRQRAQEMFNVAIELMKAKEYKAAAAQFQKGLAIDPGNRIANHNLAKLLEVAGDTDGARLHYRLATGLAAGISHEPLPDLDCPVQMGIDEADFPGFDSAKPSTFTRDQGDVGICDPMAISDFLCFQANKQKSFSSRGLPNSACSVIDTALQLIRVKNLNYQSVEKMFQDGMGPASNKAYQDLADYYANNGLCLEKDFQFNFSEDLQRGLVNRYLVFAAAVDKAASEGRALNYLCEECQTIAPNLERGMNFFESKTKNLSKNSYLALRELNEIACSKKSRIPIDKIRLKVGLWSHEIRDQIRKKNPVIVSAAPDILMSRKFYKEFKKSRPDDLEKNHTALVVGAHVAYGRCYYIIKNSWGMACEQDPPVTGEPPRVLCNKILGTYSVLAINLEASRDLSLIWADLDRP